MAPRLPLRQITALHTSSVNSSSFKSNTNLTSSNIGCRLNEGQNPRRHNLRHVFMTSLVVTLAIFACVVSPVRCQQVREEESPMGASLAFVFDITGSMYDDLVQVIQGAREILKETLKRREKPLYNYVLVPFHDPVVGPVLVTTDPQEFQTDLSRLYVQGGGDCPEMSIGAIKEALEVSLPFSFIYVFTDARSKDYYLTEEVLSLIQQKQSQVVFVLTGDCGNVTHSGYKAYEEIAATSSGQVFLLKKSQVNQVLNFVKSAVQARKVNLLSINEEEGKNQVINIPLDTHLKEVTVSVSGEDPKIFLRDPEGNRKTFRNGLNNLLSLSNVQIVNVKEPLPGSWRLRVSSSGPHTIRVTGLSTADFVAGFSKHPIKDIRRTTLRPIQGIPTYAIVNSTGLEYPSVLTDLELVDLRGNSLVKFPLEQDPVMSSLYNVSSFIPPKEYFYVKITGIDENGYFLQRTTPTAISPVKPRAPQVFMKETTHGFYDSTAVLTCQVFSLVPYTVQWFYEGQPQGYERFYNDPDNVTLAIPHASSQVEGSYMCNVTNTAGNMAALTYLDISDPPPVILRPENVSVLVGDTAVISCIAFSTVAYNLTWEKVSPFRNIASDPRIRSFNNDSLVIFNVSPRDEGKYSCIASNEGGSSRESMYLKLQVAPNARVSPKRQTYTKGTMRNFTCYAEGYPAPTYSWHREGQVLPSGGHVDVNGGYISFRNLRPSDEGQYECVASNLAGEDIARIRLAYIEAPRIREYEPKTLVAVGGEAKLHCIAEGIPTPNISWYRSDRRLQTAYGVDISRQGQMLIAGVQESDAGPYRCVASNEAGTDSVDLMLEVGSPPEIIHPPESVGIDIEGNGSLPCHAIGKPPPKLSWRRGDGRPLKTGGRFRQLPSGALEVTGVQRGDEGIYTCLAQNPFGIADSSAFLSVTGIVRPLIAYTQPYVRVVEGENANLECVILLGKPKPTLSWSRTGRLLQATNRLTYSGPGLVTITDVREEDDGEYVCRASNIGGNETYTVNLDVYLRPRFVFENEEDGQKNFSVVQGRSVFLPCTVSGHPRPSFTWFRDGSPISLTDIRYYVRRDGALEIFSADIEDTAEYKCVASNVAGEVEKNINLFVEVPPQIAGDSEETFEINVGESILLPCEVSGIPYPSVKWNKNFLPLTPNPQHVAVQDNGLYISQATIEDKAIYECIASNVAGDANKIITAIVFVPPSVEEGPSEVTVLYGQSATLECEAAGDPFPTILWRKNGVILDTENPEKGYFTSASGSLTITSVELDDGGRFSCSATNPAGVATKELFLTVHGAPEIPGTYSEYMEIIEKNPVVLPCPAVGTPKPRITWYKDSRILTGQEVGIVQLDDGSLEIDNTVADDSGTYECVAENIAGIATRNFQVKILVPPKLVGIDTFVSGPEKTHVIIEQNVTLTCPVSHDTDPAPVINWFKDNQLVPQPDPQNRVFIAEDQRSLTIIRAVVGDEARYICVAGNVAGEVERHFDLDVQVPPRVDESGLSPYNQTVTTGQSLVINCPIMGKPPPKVVWLKDGERLSADLDPNVRLLAEGRRLEINSARFTDRGRYVCIGENVAGKTTKDFSVDVHVPPTVDGVGVPENVEVVSGNSIYLTCPASGIPLPKITWFRQEAPVKANSSKVQIIDDGWTLEIKDANTSDAVRYYCLAENVAGEVEKAFDVQVLVGASIIRDNLDTEPEFIVNTTVVINCPVAGSPTPEIIWYRNGVILDASIHQRYEMLAGGRQLRIYSSQVKDKGRYTCTVNNRAGDDQVDFDVNILVPPKIDRQGPSPPAKVIINSTVTIRCPVVGYPLPDIRWLKDNQPVQYSVGKVETRSDGTELVLFGTRVSDSGRYQCIAQNSAGEDSQTYTLTVQVPPSISLDGIDINIKTIENDTSVLLCPAEGIPPPSIVWFRNGVFLDGSSSPRLTIAEDGKKLIISSTKVADAGEYLCLAGNEAGEAELNFQLDVWVSPEIDTSIIDLTPKVIKGNTAIINCPVSGIPLPSITWLKNGVEVRQDARITVLSEGMQLQIENAAEDDAADYTCVASNEAGNNRVDYKLSILVPPTIDESNVVYDRKVSIHRHVELECPVSGIPLPSVTWLVNGQLLDQLDSTTIRLKENNRILEIESVEPDHTALYTCLATNDAGELERNFNLEVLIPPEIDKNGIQTTLEVIQNKTFSLMCPASGVPDPEMEWAKDGYTISELSVPGIRLLSDGQVLEISNPQLKEAGKYTCTAINPAGSDFHDFQVEVFIPPLIGKPTPDKLHVVVGQSVSMRCTVIGTPEPTILWMKNGDNIKENGPHQMQILDNGQTLQLIDAKLSDEARFTCHVENQVGFAEKYFDLEVWTPANINGSGQRVEVPVVMDQEVILDCPAEGSPTPEITWFRNNAPIPSYGMPNVRIQKNGLQLVIISAQLLDFGDYMCLARNDAGEDRLLFVVNIIVPPEIEEGLEEVAAIVNTRAILQCETSGQPRPEVTWTKDGTPFPTTGLRHRMLPTGSMEFMIVRLEDDGTYECTASNGAGNVTRSVQLHVQIPARILDKGRGTLKVAEGKSIALTCNTEGSPAPQLYWLKYRQYVIENDRIRIMDNGSLHIRDLRRQDSGVYTCLAQNNAGTDSRDIRLRVQEPPIITVGQKIFTVLQNRTIVLPCHASGRPRPRVRWEKDGQEISSSRNYRLTNTRVHYILLQAGSLAIPHTRAEDAGAYKCIAENSAGTTTAEFSLLVQVPPVIQEAALQYVVSVGDVVSLPCKTSGSPEPTISWTKDRRRLDLRNSKYVIDDSGTLTINGIRAEDTGNYICAAENSVGKDSQTRLLRVQVPPKFLTVPRDKELTVKSRFQLRCVARGIPTPTITWKLNGKPFAAPPSLNGASTIVIRNAMREDAGEYTCVATNPANDQQVTASARVIIKVPPIVLVPPGDKAVRIAEKVVLHCTVGGDPPPEILWTKNGRPLPLNERIRKLSNGSLIIYDLLASDAGSYKCIAINDAGTSEAQSVITVNIEPKFKIEPQDTLVEIGETAMFDCTAEGVPTPNMSWWKETEEMRDGDRITILPNNSLRIIATQQSDVGVYRCLASNPIGKSYLEIMLDVVVHGQYSEWGDWGPCSVTCGRGKYSRTRICDNPQPQNGGHECIGLSTEWASCVVELCPVNGQWGSWLDWEECSTTCGPGHRTRQRLCNNPSPQYEGAPCEGQGEEKSQCNRQRCPVDGQWGQWASWGPCSSSCGEGVQERYRQCDSPPAQHGGKSCQGDHSQQQPCVMRRCAVDGNWSPWSAWSSCSLSCGSGLHFRRRRCDNPRPQNGGLYCPGNDLQQDYCNSEPCPVHGNWGLWGSWGQCSLSCDGGLQKRFRTCSNPAPSGTGRPCTGSGEDSEPCNTHSCPVDGRFGEWSEWSECSVSCGQGQRERFRECIEPAHGGRTCRGDSSEIIQCTMAPCYVLPTIAQGNLIGYINNIDIPDSTIEAEMAPTDDGTASHIEAIVHNVPPAAANHIQHLISLLTPVYWTTALEIDGAVNGYTLTGGEFMREVQVEFATGEILKMSHYANGVDHNGVLLFDVIIRGEVPELGLLEEVHLAPYHEEYIQIGPGTVYAHSSRMFRADEFTMPYAWNHTITYDETFGQMPFLVQLLNTKGHYVEILPDQKSVRFIIEASIQPGDPSNKCPTGFLHNQHSSFCQDENECQQLNPCSHTCHNTPGSFACSCRSGFSLMSDAKTCQDINECTTGLANCLPTQDCLNREGSFRCVSKCSPGFERDETGDACLDINECQADPNICEQTCQNLVGSHRCSCIIGFRLEEDGRCTDVDECALNSRPCSHNCTNSRGSYRCSCPPGFELLNGQLCRDVNECYEGRHDCGESQECVNMEGTFRCIGLCPVGFQRTASGQCEDVNECFTQQHRCYFNQRCINVEGGYQCQCPKGYKTRGPGQPCVDVNECSLGRRVCQHNCTNMRGSYRCTCPPGYRLGLDGYSCEDINECVENNIQCGPEKMCFNKRGSYSCIDIPCPPDYARDPTTNFCVLECVNPHIPCPPGAKYADIIEFRTVALPGGNPARQDLIRLTAYNQHDKFLPQTMFFILDNDPKIEFYLKTDDGKGIVYTLEPLVDDSTYQITVRARSYDSYRRHIQYQTTFIIHISVSAFPY